MKKPKFKNGTTLWNVFVNTNFVIVSRYEILDVKKFSFCGDIGYEYHIRVYNEDGSVRHQLGEDTVYIDNEVGFDNADRAIGDGTDHAFSSHRRALRFAERARKELDAKA